MAIIKVITGNEHGGAANSTQLLINGIIESKSIDFEVVALCNDKFALEIAKQYPSFVKVIKNSTPPIISHHSKIKCATNFIRLLIWFCIATFLLLKHLRKKNISAIHTTNNYALVVCCLYKYLRKFTLISHWRSVGYRKNLAFLHSNVDRFICISNCVKKSLPLKWQQKSLVVYDGLEISKLKEEGAKNKGKLRKYLNINNNKIVFGTIGTFTDIKCHNLLIESCFLLSNEYPEFEYSCVLIGSTPNNDSKKYLSTLKEKVKIYGLHDKVLFLMDDELGQPSSLISDFDFFVGSTWNNGKGEGFGLIYIEAMAQGLPIIAINVGAAKELLNNQIGTILPDNSPEIHAKEIETLCSDQNLRNKMSITSKYQSTKYDISNTINGVLAIYDQI